jgi:hypothetical protein
MCGEDVRGEEEYRIISEKRPMLGLIRRVGRPIRLLLVGLEMGADLPWHQKLHKLWIGARNSLPTYTTSLHYVSKPLYISYTCIQ